jgi:hypothetical protein
MRGGGKTLKRRGSIWSVGSERDDETREREREMRRGWVEKRTKKKDEKSARKENLRFPVRGKGKD